MTSEARKAHALDVATRILQAGVLSAGEYGSFVERLVRNVAQKRPAADGLQALGKTFAMSPMEAAAFSRIIAASEQHDPATKADQG